MGKLDALTIVVTGGSSGIGLAIARECAREGASVVIVARRQGLLEDALEELRRVSARDHRSHALDVGDAQAVRAFADWLAQQRLEPTGLVNCAGGFGPIGKTTHVDMLEFAQTIQGNFLGTVYMCHGIAPLFSSKTRPKIVNCAGGGGTFPFPNYSAYATSKAALVRFSENLALELAEDGIDVNCIAPGFVPTRLHERTLAVGPASAGAFFEETKRRLAAGNVSPDRSAELTAFLLSPESDGITAKYISAAWDPWQEPRFQERLRSDKHFATLRRIDDQRFSERPSGDK